MTREPCTWRAPAHRRGPGRGPISSLGTESFIYKMGTKPCLLSRGAEGACSSQGANSQAWLHSPLWFLLALGRFFLAAEPSKMVVVVVVGQCEDQMGARRPHR